MVEVLAVVEVFIARLVPAALGKVGVEEGASGPLDHLLESQHLLGVLLAVDKHVERRARRHHNHELHAVLAAEVADVLDPVEALLVKVSRSILRHRKVVARR